MRLWEITLKIIFIWFCLILVSSCSEESSSDSLSSILPSKVLEISSPEDGSATNQQSLLVNGSCLFGETVFLSGDIQDEPTTLCLKELSNISKTNGIFSHEVILTDEDGVKEVTVRQNPSSSSNQITIHKTVHVTLDTLPPSLLFHSPARPATTKKRNLDVKGSCERGITVHLSGNIELSEAPCLTGGFKSSVTLLSGLSGDGIKVVRATQTDLAGNEGYSRLPITLDTQPPLLRFNLPNAGITLTAKDVFIGGVCEEGITVSVSGDIMRSLMTICSGGNFTARVTLSNGDGSKNISVTQKDPSGNIGMATLNLMLDATPPTMNFTLLRTSSQIVKVLSGASVEILLNERSIEVEGTCESGVTVNLSGDIEAPSEAPCLMGVFTSSVTLLSRDGVKVVRATQTDLVGNEGYTQLSVTLDTQAPLLRFHLPNAGTTLTAKDVVIKGACEEGIDIDVSGDIMRPLMESCSGENFTTSVTLSNGDGSKNISITQKDPSGNIGMATLNVILDLSVEFRSPANGLLVKDHLINLEGFCGEPGLGVDLRGDIASLTDPVPCVGETFRASVTLTGGDGAKVVTATQTGGFGNHSATLNLMLDATLPTMNFRLLRTSSQVVEVLSGASVEILLNERSIEVEGTCESGITVNLSGDIEPSEAPCLMGAFKSSVTLLSGLSGDGVKVVRATQTDLAGNEGYARLSVTLDTQAPLLSFHLPNAGTILTAKDVVIEGVCEEGIDIDVSGDIMHPLMETCFGGNFTTSVTLSNGDGSKNISVTQKDPSGNIGMATLNLTLDTTPPLLRFSSPSPGTIIYDTDSAMLIEGVCETGRNINIFGDITSPVTGICTTDTFQASVTLTDGGGGKMILATQQDIVGNEGQGSLILTVSKHLRDITQISSGFGHTCALTEGGNVKCWGLGESGELGHQWGTRSIPEFVPDFLENGQPKPVSVSMISSIPIPYGFFSAIPINVDTSLEDPSSLSQIKTVSSGSSHTCALTKSGTVKCWGAGSRYGQLGIGELAPSAIPLDVHTSLSDSRPLSGIKSISAGHLLTCVLTTSDTVKCWGYGLSGELGNGANSSSSIPVDVHTSSFDPSPLDGIAAISSGRHICALTIDDTVKCWGYGLSGELGNGANFSSSTPVDVHKSLSDPSLLDGITAISSSNSHTCALTAGKHVKCWGNGSEGRLGNGANSSSSTPVDVHTSSSDFSPLGGITAISSSNSHTCALTEGKHVKCWGIREIGGRGSLFNKTPIDIRVGLEGSDLLSDITAVSSGGYYTCALRGDSSVKCWGSGKEGKLGIGYIPHYSGPVSVYRSQEDSPLLEGIRAISSGYHHTCALMASSLVKCWGNFGLGNGEMPQSLTPVDVHTSSSNFSPLSGVIAVSSGYSHTTGDSHTCVLTREGYVKCWGDGTDGQLGNNKEVSSSLTPVDVHTSLSDSSPLGNITAVSSGGNHTCVITRERHVKCWGDGAGGQLGNGQVSSSLTPVDVHTSSSNLSPLSGVIAVSSGSNHTCVLIAPEGVTGGTAKCWGSKILRDHTETFFSSTPVDVHTSSENLSPLTGIRGISSGFNHTCLVTIDGIVKCWGRGLKGQLGNGETSNSLDPVDVHTSLSDSSPLNNIAKINVGGDHSCALTTGGIVKCWGSNEYGELGNGEVGGVPAIAPEDVHTSLTSSHPLSGITDINSGLDHTCALTTGGTVKCWGHHSGSGSMTLQHSSIPIDVINP